MLRGKWNGNKSSGEKSEGIISLLKKFFWSLKMIDNINNKIYYPHLQTFMALGY